MWTTQRGQECRKESEKCLGSFWCL